MPIYKHYDQESLDAQYNNRAAVPDFMRYLDSWQARSAAVRGRLKHHADLAYGPHPRERLDIFTARAPGAPVLVFYHGGYWQALAKESFNFLAEGFVPAGVTTVIAGYPLAPEATMDRIVAACRRSLAWLHRHIADFGGNPARLHVAGHSAGGHLVAMLLATHWRDVSPDLPVNLIKSGLALSGLFDLSPIRRCYLNTVLGLDEAAAHRNSPTQLAPTQHCPLLLAVGNLESDEYHAQSRKLSLNWKARGMPVTEVLQADHHHFSILEALADPQAALFQAVRHQCLSNCGG